MKRAAVISKVIAFLLALMLLFALTGCENGNDSLYETAPPPSDRAQLPPPSQTMPSPEPEPSPEVRSSPFGDYAYALPADGRYNSISGLVLVDPDEYVSKPCAIQEGTVLSYFVPYVNCVVGGILGEGVFAGNVYEGLVYRYMNDPEDIRGLIAENWSASDDLCTWTFRIREGVFFTDGTVCDANAVAESWEMTGENCFFANANIESWEVVDDLELVIHLSSPCAWFESTLADRMVVSPSAVRQYGLESPKACVGTGPYYIETYDVNKDQAVLKANRQYYLPEHYPCIETVNLFTEDPSVMISKLSSGELTNAGTVFTRSNYNLDSVRGTDPDGVAVAYKNESAVWLSPRGFDKFAIKEVREAMCRLADFEAINGELYGGEGLVMDSIWPRGTIGYLPTEDLRHNVDEGLELLASVGLGIEDISFTSYCDLTDSDAVLYGIAGQLEALGADITLTYRHPAASFSNWDEPWAIIRGLSLFRITDPYNSFFAYEYDLPDLLAKTFGSDTYPFRHFWQDMYDSELYELMHAEYEAMNSATAWDELEEHFENITACAQKDHSAIGGVQPPVWLYLDSGFKNGVWYWDDGSQQFALQFYCLYRQAEQAA